MVTALSLGGVIAVSLAASAQAADWSKAGGALLVGAPATVVEAADPPRLPAPDQPFASEIEAVAARHGLDPKLLHSLVLVESSYRPEARSPAGAVGLTQLMPGAAAETGVTDREDIDQNLRGGALYLTRQIQRFGDLRLALAAYNAGPERLARLGRIPPIAETEAYVERVIDCFLALSAGRTVNTPKACRAEAPHNER